MARFLVLEAIALRKMGDVRVGPGKQVIVARVGVVSRPAALVLFVACRFHWNLPVWYFGDRRAASENTSVAGAGVVFRCRSRPK